MTVETADRYIRVRPGWIEKLLLISVLAQIILTAWLLIYGSAPAREAQMNSEGTRELLCQRVFDNSPDDYYKYLEYCPVRRS